VAKRFRVCEVNWRSIKEKPDLKFDYNMKVAAIKNLGGGPLYMTNELKLTAANPQKINIDTPANGKSGWLLPIQPHYGDGGIQAGWREEVDLGSNDLLEPLKSGAYIILRPKGGM